MYCLMQQAFIFLNDNNCCLDREKKPLIDN